MWRLTPYPPAPSPRQQGEGEPERDPRPFLRPFPLLYGEKGEGHSGVKTSLTSFFHHSLFNGEGWAENPYSLSSFRNG
jgi:hypothetical protein